MSSHVCMLRALAFLQAEISIVKLLVKHPRSRDPSSLVALFHFCAIRLIKNRNTVYSSRMCFQHSLCEANDDGVSNDGSRCAFSRVLR